MLSQVGHLRELGSSPMSKTYLFSILYNYSSRGKSRSVLPAFCQMGVKFPFCHHFLRRGAFFSRMMSAVFRFKLSLRTIICWWPLREWRRWRGFRKIAPICATSCEHLKRRGGVGF